MRLVEHEGLEIDVCDACHGIWLDPDEFQFLPKLAASLSAPKNPADGWNFKCPGCESRDAKPISTELGSAHRCGSCFGVFIPRELLADESLVSDNDPKPDANWIRDAGGPLTDLLEFLSSFT